MQMIDKTALKNFRVIALLEGISYIVLVGIAMPLKYWADMPLPVKYTGWAHGVLFILYCILLLQSTLKYKWSFVHFTIAFVASLLPFGTFVLDALFLKKQLAQNN